MTAALAARALIAIALGLAGSSCVFHSNPDITSEPDSVEIKNRFATQLRDVEYMTGKRYRGKSIHINSPVSAIYRDWRKMPVAKIRGRRQGGLTSWRAVHGHTTVSLAAWHGTTPEWLIRHEALHTVLLSHSITGHPTRYASLFRKSYWWMPESYYREKTETKGESSPLIRSAFNHSQRDDEGELTAACCPMCGIDLESLAANPESKPLTCGSIARTETRPAR